MQILTIITFLGISISACNADTSVAKPYTNSQTQIAMDKKIDTAYFANGCFWCTEAIFQDLKGVKKVESGYTGGTLPNPTYEEVSTGLTKHAEVLQVVYDPQEISFADLLEVFWNTHDPTTLNRQGADVGTQYRSGIFYLNEEQRQLAEDYKTQLDSSGVFKNPIVTEITAFDEFYPAEDYHQNYYKLNNKQPYCQFVIRPKVEKFNKQFGDKYLKKD